MKRIYPWAIAALFSVACSANEPEPYIEVLNPTEIDLVDQEGNHQHHPAVPGLNIRSRHARRLSVKQLERTWEQVGEFPAGSVVIPQNLALTLGQPDYLRVTEPSFEPSPLFMKFMVDLGAILCTNIAQADAQRGPGQKVLTLFTDQDENLRHLILRFWGVGGKDADPYIPRLKQVFEESSKAPLTSVQGWQAVCLALSTAPEFLLY